MLHGSRSLRWNRRRIYGIIVAILASRADTWIAGETSRREASCRGHRREPRERGRCSAAITVACLSSRVFVPLPLEHREEYTPRYFASFLVGTRRQPSPLPCQTPPRKRFYNLVRSVSINMQLAVSREPLSPEGSPRLTDSSSV